MRAHVIAEKCPLNTTAADIWYMFGALVTINSLSKNHRWKYFPVFKLDKYYISRHHNTTGSYKLITRCVHHQSESPRAPVSPLAVGLTLFLVSRSMTSYTASLPTFLSPHCSTLIGRRVLSAGDSSSQPDSRSREQSSGDWIFTCRGTGVGCTSTWALCSVC